MKSIEVGDIFQRSNNSNEKVLIIEGYGDEILALVKDHGLVYFKIYHDEDELLKNYFFVKNDEKFVNKLIIYINEALRGF